MTICSALYSVPMSAGFFKTDPCAAVKVKILMALRIEVQSQTELTYSATAKAVHVNDALALFDLVHGVVRRNSVNPESLPSKVERSKLIRLIAVETA
jgi:hypothetical protein